MRSPSRSWRGSIRRSASRWPRIRRWGPGRSGCGARGAEGGVAAPALHGRKLASFGLPEPEAGTDAGNMRTRASSRTANGCRRGQAVHHQRRTEISGCVTITAVTGETDGRKEISNMIVPTGTPGYEVGEPYRKMGWNASDTRPLAFEDCRVPGPGCSAAAARASRSSSTSSTAVGSGSRRWAWPRPGRPRRGDRLRQGAAGLRPADLQVPVDPGQDRRPLGPDRGRPPAHLARRPGEGRGASRSPSPPPRRS